MTEEKCEAYGWATGFEKDDELFWMCFHCDTQGCGDGPPTCQTNKGQDPL